MSAAAIPTAAPRARPAPGSSAPAAPVKVSIGDPVLVAFAPAVGVASAATVFSNSGVVVNVMRSPPKARDALVNGSAETAVAPSNATRSDAGASGSSEARSKGSRGLNTLQGELVEIVEEAKSQRRKKEKIIDKELTCQ